MILVVVSLVSFVQWSLGHLCIHKSCFQLISQEKQEHTRLMWRKRSSDISSRNLQNNWGKVNYCLLLDFEPSTWLTPLKRTWMFSSWPVLYLLIYVSLLRVGSNWSGRSNVYLSTWLPSTTTKRVHIPSIQRKRKSSRMPTGREIHGKSFFSGMLYSYTFPISSKHQGLENGVRTYDPCCLRVKQTVA